MSDDCSGRSLCGCSECVPSMRRKADVYALKQPHPDGGEWIQEHDSLEDVVSFQSHSGGVLVRRERIEGQPGWWWVEVDPLHNPPTCSSRK